jgi:tripartite-type tricarboxylate transporter receptor subunit TctC
LTLVKLLRIGGLTMPRAIKTWPKEDPDMTQNDAYALNRRSLLASGLGLAAAALPALPALAATYPASPVKISVPFGAGGIGDITVRIVADQLSKKLGQNFIIENMPGPGGVAAARSTLQGGTEGYALALFSNGTAISVGMFNKLRFDPVKEFVPISALGYFDFVFATNGQGRFKTLEDFLKEARAKPGDLNVGTIAIGSTQNLSAELFKSSANIDFRIVPYRNTPDIILAAMRGDVDLVIDSFASMRSNFDDGKLRPLATSSGKRSVSLPQVPTVSEAGVPGYDVTSWNAIFAPTGTPESVISILNKAIAEAIAVPEIKAKMLDLGIEAKASSPQEIEERLQADIKKWSAIIDKAGIPKQ